MKLSMDPVFFPHQKNNNKLRAVEAKSNCVSSLSSGPFRALCTVQPAAPANYQNEITFFSTLQYGNFDYYYYRKILFRNGFSGCNIESINS